MGDLGEFVGLLHGLEPLGGISLFVASADALHRLSLAAENAGLHLPPLVDLHQFLLLNLHERRLECLLCS